MNQALEERLAKIWLPPNFASFFNKYSKRAPIKIRAGQTIFYEGDEPGKL